MTKAQRNSGEMSTTEKSSATRSRGRSQHPVQQDGLGDACRYSWHVRTWVGRTAGCVRRQQANEAGGSVALQQSWLQAAGVLHQPRGQRVQCRSLRPGNEYSKDLEFTALSLHVNTAYHTDNSAISCPMPCIPPLINLVEMVYLCLLCELSLPG